MTWSSDLRSVRPLTPNFAVFISAPRAASVVAKGEATLWALDRISFRTILLDVSMLVPFSTCQHIASDTTSPCAIVQSQHTSRKRRMYETFLLSVPILASLEGYERAKIADALESRTFQSGEQVIQEGESGDEFYIIESGTALVEKSDTGVIGELKRGDYFGGQSLCTNLTDTVLIHLSIPLKRTCPSEPSPASGNGESWWSSWRQAEGRCAR